MWLLAVRSKDIVPNLKLAYLSSRLTLSINSSLFFLIEFDSLVNLFVFSKNIINIVNFQLFMGFGVWGLGFGVWGLGDRKSVV